jgi:glycosyltransferase involved in cell wall biosynthesis
MLEAEIDSSMLSLSSDLESNERIAHLHKVYQFIAKIDGKILKYLTKQANKKYGLFSFPVLGFNISRKDQIRSADIIYLHWINGGFLNLRSIRKLAKLNKPIIFFLHDMWAITGGCHHSFQCEKYQAGCEACQVFSGRKAKDLSKMGFQRKAVLFSGFNNLYFVSPSKWLYQCTKNSKLTFEKPVFHIPNFIDKDFFKPFDKTIAKRILNIDIAYKVICFGAVSVDSPYKGFSYLTDALNILNKELVNEKIMVLVFGDFPQKRLSDIPFEARIMGKLRDELSTLIVYNASDVFLAPSLADNLPTTVMESMCCGTPVVGFDVGGIPDLIQHKENGYLAKYQDSDDLAKGIVYCLKNEIKGKLKTIFEPANIIKMHVDLIKVILTEKDESR